VTPGLSAVGAIGNLHVVPNHDDTLPLIVGTDFIGLYANQRILPHPQNLLPHRRKGVQAIGVKAEIDRHDVRSVI
jgi:hypothetical protein